MTPPKREYPENRTKKVRSIGVPDELWNAAKAKAAADGTTLTDVLNAYLKRYVR